MAPSSESIIVFKVLCGGKGIICWWHYQIFQLQKWVNWKQFKSIAFICLITAAFEFPNDTRHVRRRHGVFWAIIRYESNNKSTRANWFTSSSRKRESSTLPTRCWLNRLLNWYMWKRGEMRNQVQRMVRVRKEMTVDADDIGICM